MRILHVISRLNIGGTASWLNQLSISLQEQGHVVRIISGCTEPNEAPALMNQELDVKFLSSLRKSFSLVKDVQSFFKIRMEIKKFAPTIINTHTSKAGILARLANLTLLRKRSRIVHTLHGHLLYGYFPKWKSLLIICIERTLGIFTDLIFIPGHLVALEAKKAGLVKASKVFEVVPGVCISMPQKYVPAEERLKVGWLGRLTQIKRPDRVIELAEKFPGIDFHIGGAGELMQPLLLNCPRNVFFEGWVEAVEFWPRMDIALLTSDNEAMPISLIEAGMLGIPAITTNVGSTSEVVVDGKSGFVVNADMARMCEALQKMSGSPEIRIEFGINAREFTSRAFSPKRQVELHIEGYMQALETSRKF
jgi:glycosyltransferase involved in cell wall biosynthesis